MLDKLRDAIHNHNLELVNQLEVLEKSIDNPKLLFTESSYKRALLINELTTVCDYQLDSQFYSRYKKWIAQILNSYFIEYITENHPNLIGKFKIVSDIGGSNIASFVVADSNNVDLLRFNIAVGIFGTTMFYKTIESYDEYMSSEFEHCTSNLKSHINSINKLDVIINKPIKILKEVRSIRDFSILLRSLKSINKEHLNSERDKLVYCKNETIKQLTSSVNRYGEYRPVKIEQLGHVKLLELFFIDLGYKRSIQEKYYGGES